MARILPSSTAFALSVACALAGATTAGCSLLIGSLGGDTVTDGGVPLIDGGVEDGGVDAPVANEGGDCPPCVLDTSAVGACCLQ